MVGETEVLLGDLEFHHHLRVAEPAEEGAEGLARLEVDGAVLDLDDHVVGEFAVQRQEFFYGLVGPVGAGGAVDEGAPHHDAAIGSEGFTEHVGAVRVGTAVVLRSGLAFGVGLDQEAAEVGDGGVDLGRLVLPPFADLRVQRIAALQPAQGDGGGPFDGEIGLDAVFTQDRGDLRHAGDVLRVQDQRVGVDVVEHCAVEAHGGAEFAVAADAGFGDVGAGPFPHGFAGVAALHGVVKVVPVVQQAQVVGRGLLHIQAGAGLAEHFGALEGIDAVAQARFGAGGDAALAVLVENMIAFRREGGIDLRPYGGKDFGVRARRREPEFAAVLRDGNGAAAAGEQDRSGEEDEEEGFPHSCNLWFVQRYIFPAAGREKDVPNPFNICSKQDGRPSQVARPFPTKSIVYCLTNNQNA